MASSTPLSCHDVLSRGLKGSRDGSVRPVRNLSWRIIAVRSGKEDTVRRGMERSSAALGQKLANLHLLQRPGTLALSHFSALATGNQIQAAPTDKEAMTPPFNVLVTGSTKGIGYALAKEFLEAGDNVIICSRSEERVQIALEELSKEFGERVVGITCDVRDAKSIEAMAVFAKSRLGYVDLWINNAGTNAYTYKPLVDSSDQAIMEIVETNTLGVMLCCRQALRMMKEQPRGGHIFNMDGAGADGNPTPRFAAYGATKRSLAQFTKSLQAELRMQGVKNVIVHNLSPGMVTTDLLMSGGDSRQAKFFINVLAESPETVAKYLVPRVRAVPKEQSTSSTYIRFLTGWKAYTQILARLVFKVRKDRYLKED